MSEEVDAAVLCRGVHACSIQRGGGDSAATAVQGLQGEAHTMRCCQAHTTAGSLRSRTLCCLLPPCVLGTPPCSVEVNSHSTNSFQILAWMCLQVTAQCSFTELRRRSTVHACSTIDAGSFLHFLISTHSCCKTSKSLRKVLLSPVRFQAELD